MVKGRAMPWHGWLGAAMLTMTTLVTGVGEAGAADCWLLDESRREQAADQGLCGDAFSRNSQAGTQVGALPLPAPLAKPPSGPSAKPAAKAPSKTAPTQARNTGPHTARTIPARPPHGGASSGGDFFTNFQRDFSSLVDLLAGKPSTAGRRRTDGTASLPSHMDHSGR